MSEFALSDTETMNGVHKMATINFFKRTVKPAALKLTETLNLTLCILVFAIISFAQEGRSPNKGFQAGNSYAISEIENVNLQNGNLNLNIPLASLSPGRGTSPGYTVSLRYNSKLWDSHLQHKSNGDPDQNGSTSYTKEILDLDADGGWVLNANGYELNVINRTNLEDQAPCVMGGQSAFSRNAYAYKVQMKAPDGNVITFRPYGTGPGFDDAYQDDFFSVDTSGVRHIYTLEEWSHHPSCNHSAEPIIPAGTGMNYYSSDGSAMRLYIPPGATGEGHWKLYLPDGTLVESFPADDTTITQRITDRNGNKLTWKGATMNNMEGIKIQNDVGKYIFISTYANSQNKIITGGFNGAELTTTVNWKYVFVHHRYTTTNAWNAPEFEKHDEKYWTFEVPDNIVLPDQASNLEYGFTYFADDAATEEGDYTSGWGEIKSITLPSEAKAEYQYASLGTTPELVLKHAVLNRTLTYLNEYDGTSAMVTEKTKYSLNSVTGPDGGKLLEGTPWNTGYLTYNCRTWNPDGSISEKIWATNIATMVSGVATNAYVKTEFTTITDTNGAPVWTAIKDYDYDKNGNVLEIREYDWVDYNLVPRTGTGIYIRPTGLPNSSYLTLKRKTVNTYYNPTPIATDTSFSGNNYAEPTSPKLHNVIKSTEIRDGGGTPKARSEFYYDDASNTGNLIETRLWDSSKGALNQEDQQTGSKLGINNSISTHTAYDSYGNPTLITDANEKQTQIIYGSVGGYTGLYATQTKTVYGTAVERTANVSYDFTTGLVISSTDVDNGVTNATEYDPLGRPTKVVTAQSTALESWVKTEYDDVARRVVITSDLETKGDGRKVAAQFYDQLGRVRLSKTLEDSATQSAVNETDGIKVQTRYTYDLPTDPVNSNGTYVLTSNPYRAATSGAASGETTMGWTLNYETKTGKHTETTTFSGAALPAPWGSSADSTGVVKMDLDRERTLVTDQAGKQRISSVNALGQMTAVWEITTADDSTVSVTFPDASGSGISAGYLTSYTYDTLGNLTGVTQGSQTPRSFSYSSLSRLTAAFNPESGTSSFTYDGNGNVISKSQLRSGSANVLTSYTYDALNRVLQRSYSTPNGTPSNYQATPTVIYTYDDPNIAHSKGKLTKVSSSISTTEYTAFDLTGRVTAHKQNTNGNEYSTGYTFNLGGTLTEETYPSTRKVKATLDNSGDLSQVQSKKNSTAGYWTYANSFTYNAAGAVTSMQLGNGHWESTQFNARLQPTRIALGSASGATNLLQLDYSYGTTQNNSNVQLQTITVSGLNHPFVQSYTYDSLNRVLSATETNNSQPTWKQAFTYDRYGNRNFDETNTTTLAKACIEGGNPVVCAADRKKFNPSVNSANNRLSTSDDYSYDLAGNTTADANSQQYIYDGENKMVQAQDGGGNPLGTYYYDGEGRRIKKIVPNGETTIFVYDASGKMVAEYSTELSQTPEVSYLTSDNLGTPRINTNAGGGVISRHDYHPFGEGISTSERTAGSGYQADSIRKQFTGYERDNESGLDFAQARMYANQLGRFTATDPVIISKDHPSTPQRWNLYIYVINNPLKFTDPDGKKPKRVIDVFVLFQEGAEGRAEWTALRKKWKKKGVIINIHRAGNKGPTAATAENFLKSIKSEGRTTIVVGHSSVKFEYGEKLVRGEPVRGLGAGIMFDDYMIGMEGRGKTLKGVNIKAANLVVLSCDFGATFDNLKSTNKTNFIYLDPGRDGYGTDLDTIDLQARTIAEVIADGSNGEGARLAGQVILNLNPYKSEIDGDHMVRRVLGP